MSIAVSGIIAFAFRGLNVAVALLTVVITSHTLGTEGRGLFALGTIVVGVVAATSGGLTAATTYQVSNQRRASGEVLLTSGSLAAVISALAIAAGASVAALATGDLGATALPVALACSAVILNGVAAGVFLGNDAIVRYNMALVLPPLIALAALAVDFFVLGHETAVSALWAFAFGQVLTFPILLGLAAQGRLVQGVRFNPGVLHAVVRFAAVAGLASGVSFANYRADTVVVTHFEGKTGVAIYANAAYIAESVWQVSGSLALATFGRLGALDRDAAAQLTARIMRHTVLLLGAICLGLFLVADIVVALLFDPQYRGTAWALRFLLPGVWIYGLAAAFSGFYTYQRGMPWVSAAVAATGLAIDLPLALLLTPRFGVNGAALASSSAYAAAIVSGTVLFARSNRIPLHRVWLFGRAELVDYVRLRDRVMGALAR